MTTTRSASFAVARGLLLGVAFLASGCATRRIDWGCLASRDTAPDGNERARALGPVIEQQASAKGLAFSAVRPFYSKVYDPDRKRLLTEFLWPLGAVKDLGEDRFWRFLTVYGNDFDTGDPKSRFRFVIFPLVFAGRDVDGEGYFAVFPLAGRINEYLGQDRFAFILFPLYANTSVKDLKTLSVLWPFISRTRGEGVSRFRVFPFYGRSIRADRWKKQFVCWPVWTSVRYPYPGEPGEGFILFPLFGHARVGEQETWMVIPPLFRLTRGGEERQLNSPWPFVQYSRGAADKLYFWPLWGKKESEGVKSWFLLWPLVGGSRSENRKEATHLFYIAPFLSAGSRGAAEALTGRHFKLWPLCSYRREGEQSRFRAPELWPAREAGPVERNLAPFWTLYSRVRVKDVREQEVLWGLFRRRTQGTTHSATSLFPVFEASRDGEGEGARRLSVLRGLFEYRREGLRKTLRLLYFLDVGP